MKGHRTLSGKVDFMAKKKTAYRKNKQDRFMVYMMIFIVLFILVVVSIKSMEIRSELEGYKGQEAQLSQEKADLEQEAGELEELEKTVKTKGYAEKVAREQLGLIYPDEIQFIEEK